MEIEIHAKFQVVKYDGTAGEIEVSKICDFPVISNEVLMKALNAGDLSRIPSLFGTENYGSALSDMFRDSMFGRLIWDAKDISSKSIYGQVKFIAVRNGERVMRWEYV